MGKVYCSSDWHGCGDVARKVLDYLQPDDILYYLGDIQDRGNDGFELLQKLMTRDKTFYIKGNHDAMMTDAIPQVIKDMKELGYLEGQGYELWLHNGAWHTLSKVDQYTSEQLMKMKKFLDSCPKELRYMSPAGHTVIMEHAGYTPFDIPHRSHDPLWDREHFYDKWGGFMNGKWEKNSEVDTTYLVHGHTPVQYLKFMYGYDGKPEELTKEDMIAKRQFMYDVIKEGEKIIKPEVIRYCSGHKFDIDMCTIASDRIALLDLDTFETIYFDKE